jgi:hypothetical protein
MINTRPTTQTNKENNTHRIAQMLRVRPPLALAAPVLGRGRRLVLWLLAVVGLRLAARRALFVFRGHLGARGGKASLALPRSAHLFVAQARRVRSRDAFDRATRSIARKLAPTQTFNCKPTAPFVFFKDVTSDAARVTRQKSRSARLDLRACASASLPKHAHSQLCSAKHTLKPVVWRAHNKTAGDCLQRALRTPKRERQTDTMAASLSSWCSLQQAPTAASRRRVRACASSAAVAAPILIKETGAYTVQGTVRKVNEDRYDVKVV